MGFLTNMRNKKIRSIEKEIFSVITYIRIKLTEIIALPYSNYIRHFKPCRTEGDQHDSPLTTSLIVGKWSLEAEIHKKTIVSSKLNFNRNVR